MAKEKREPKQILGFQFEPERKNIKIIKDTRRRYICLQSKIRPLQCSEIKLKSKPLQYIFF